MIVVFVLPELSPAAQDLIGLLPRIGFPSMKDFCERVIGEEPKQRVHVIWHHAPCIQAVPRFRKMLKRCRDEIRDYRSPQKTAADSGVKFRLNALAEEFLKPFFFGRRNWTPQLSCSRDDVPFLKFEGPPNVERERICQTERHEIDCVVRLPVWKSAAAANAGHGGIVAERSATRSAACGWNGKVGGLRTAGVSPAFLNFLQFARPKTQNQLQRRRRDAGGTKGIWQRGS
jgi:hypothetical protein